MRCLQSSFDEKNKIKNSFSFCPPSSSSSSSICNDLCPQRATNPSNIFQDPSHNVDEWMHCISMGALGTKHQREKEKERNKSFRKNVSFVDIEWR